MAEEIISTDILIIGSGMAGIRAAIEAHEKGVDVVLVTKGPFGQDGAVTWMAGFGYQAPLYSPDSVETHIKDSIMAGKFLNNQKLVVEFLKFAPRSVEELHNWGARFGRKGDKFVQIRLPGHSYDRSLTPVGQGIYLGPEYRKALPHQIRRRKGIKVMDDIFITDLLLKNGTVVGALGIDLKEGKFKVFVAKSTILATGGFMACYEFTTASPTSTGDGHGIAYRAGAKMMDMEFVQFFPTVALWPPTLCGDMTPYGFLIYVHGIFYNIRGERFMERYYPQEKDFATREAASRAIVREVREGRGSPHGGAYLCFRHLPRNLLNDLLSGMYIEFDKALKKGGIDLREDAVEVGPAAHYVQGGCWIDEKCRTSLPGLFAVGEFGSGGKDGADRLAGNALPFCMAMGYTGGAEAAERAKSMDTPQIDKGQVERLKEEALAPLKREKGVMPWEIKTKIRKTMATHAIFARTKEGLTTALNDIERIKAEDLLRLSASAKPKSSNISWIEALEAENMLTVSEMVLRSALMREESRGLHERADFPEEDPNWLKHIIIEKVVEGMKFSTQEVTFPYIKPT